MIGSPFHSAIIVPELHPALEELGLVLGLCWANVREPQTTSVWTPDGRLDVVFRGTFSKPGPMRIEVIEAVPGTLWMATTDFVLHHVSFWSSDIVADACALVHQGYPIMATGWGTGDGSPTLFTYHQKGDGPYMELLDEREKPQYEEWWNEI